MASAESFFSPENLPGGNGVRACFSVALAASLAASAFSLIASFISLARSWRAFTRGSEESEDRVLMLGVLMTTQGRVEKKNIEQDRTGTRYQYNGSRVHFEERVSIEANRNKN